MNHVIGTLPWARASEGALSRRESISLWGELVRAQLGLIPDECLHKAGIRRPLSSGLSIENLAPPDSAAAAVAARACRDASPAYLYNHCERSYGWGRILGVQLGLEPDPELLYVAAMFHDLGLTETFGTVEGRPTCFSLISADEAARGLTESGWDDGRIEQVCEAITLHVNLRVDLHHGPEAHLLNLATALDTTGLRKWKLTTDDVQMLVDRHPRLDQNTAIACCWKQEAQNYPASRAGWLERNVKFSGRLRNAPFA